MSETQHTAAPEKTLEHWQAKAEEYLAGWKRSQADYQNREKELGREKQYAIARAMGEFIDVWENLWLTIQHIPEEQKNLGWVQGIGHVLREFENVMKRNAMSPYHPLKGTVFNPAEHEAVSEESGEPGKIIREVSPGVRMSERIIRPAKVIVGKAS